MRLGSPRPKSLRPLLSWLLCFFLVVSAILAPYESASAAYDGARNNRFDASSGTCDTTDSHKYLNYNPTGTNLDFNIELTNTTCIAFIAATGTALWLANKAATAICQAAVYPPNTAAATPNTTLQATDVPYPNPTLPARIASLTSVCAAMIANTSAVSTACAVPATAAVACPNAVLSTKDTSSCCASLSLYLIALAAMFAALAIIHGKANQAYNTGRICGYDWYGWDQLNKEGNHDDSGRWTKVKGAHQKCLSNLFLGTSLSGASGCEQNSSNDIKNKSYREFIYGGVEESDNGNDACSNPTTWSHDRKIRILGYDQKEQQYYTTGPGSAPAYACYRFLARAQNDNGYTAEQDQTAMQKAYACCKARSQNAVCIKSEGGSRDVNNLVTLKTDSTNKFCTIGSQCTHNGVVFETYASTQQVNYACVKTYSVCPYNHLLGGGTETKKENGDDLVNFCQFMKHCSKLPLLPYVRTSNLTGGYIDSACRDLKGDSQNFYSYTAELLPISTRGFTAPMVQCFKETMQNIFLNRAGHTECTNPDEPPDQNEECTSGYKFHKGLALPGDSFFIKMQKRFQLLIKLVLTISVTFYGVMILLAVPKAYIERKNLFPYILKIALVCYFTMGTAWQDVLLDGILGSSGTLAAITFKPDDVTNPSKLDGCQFPRYNYADTNSDTKYDHPAYPPGRDYLEVWDVLDCKLANALGFGPSLSVPNLILMILAGFLTGGLGIIFVIASFAFAFFLIFMTIRALQFFLVAMTSVIILMYVSVFIIPLSLFNRTKGIFDGWWKQMLGFILQPMILFAYLGVLIAIFDNIVIGSATFTSTSTITINGVTGPDIYGKSSEKNISCNSAAQNDSIYCIFKIADVKTYTGFEALGIGLPILGSMNATKLMTIIKGALLMYIFSSFMDKIAEVAATLVGGKEIIGGGWANNFKPHEMAAKAASILGGIQSRGMAAAGSAARKGGELASNAVGRANSTSNKHTTEATDKGGSHIPGRRSDSEPKQNLDDNTTKRMGDENKLGDENKSGADNTQREGANAIGRANSTSNKHTTEAADKGGSHIPGRRSDSEPKQNLDDNTTKRMGDENKSGVDNTQREGAGEKISVMGGGGKTDAPPSPASTTSSSPPTGGGGKATDKTSPTTSGGESSSNATPTSTVDNGDGDKKTDSDTTPREGGAKADNKTDSDVGGGKKENAPALPDAAGGNKENTPASPPNQPTAAQNSTEQKSSGGTPSYMDSTASSRSRNEATTKQFGVDAKAPTGGSSGGISSSPSPMEKSTSSSVKSATPSSARSSAPMKSRPPAASSAGSSSVKSAVPSSKRSSAPMKSRPSSGGSATNYMSPTTSSSAKQKPPVSSDSTPRASGPLAPTKK